MQIMVLYLTITYRKTNKKYLTLNNLLKIYGNLVGHLYHLQLAVFFGIGEV